jgi:hypothetical protein
MSPLEQFGIWTGAVTGLTGILVSIVSLVLNHRTSQRQQAHEQRLNEVDVTATARYEYQGGNIERLYLDVTNEGHRQFSVSSVIGHYHERGMQEIHDRGIEGDLGDPIVAGERRTLQIDNSESIHGLREIILQLVPAKELCILAPPGLQLGDQWREDLVKTIDHALLSQLGTDHRWSMVVRPGGNILLNLRGPRGAMGGLDINALELLYFPERPVSNSFVGAQDGLGAAELKVRLAQEGLPSLIELPEGGTDICWSASILEKAQLVRSQMQSLLSQ